MAPGIAGYLPPLGRCLDGQDRILSWQDAYLALSTSCLDASTPLPSFFTEEQVRASLRSPFDTNSAASPQSKAKFETLTSAINVTPEGSKSYNIKEIKDDSVWLSREAKIDEVQALRIAVLEWHSRPASQLLASSGNGSGLQDQHGAGKSAQSFATSNGMNGASKTAQDDVQSATQRKRRLLELVVLEENSLLKCSELFVRQAVWHGTSQQSVSRTPESAQSIGESILKHICPHGRRDAAIQSAIDAMQRRVGMMEQGSHWLGPNGHDEVEGLWADGQFAAMALTLQISLSLVGSSHYVLSSNTVLNFFRFMSNHGFFSEVQPQSQRQQSLVQQLQALTAILCISVLDIRKLGTCIDPGLLAYQASATDAKAAAYINDPYLVSDLHEIFMATMNGGAALPAPVLFLWSCILLMVKDFSNQSTHGDGRSSPPPETSESPNVYRQAFERIYDKPYQEDPALQLAGYAVDSCQVFDMMNQIVWTIHTAFGSGVDSGVDEQCRQQLLYLLKASRRLVRYGSEMFGSLLAVLAGDRQYWDQVQQTRSDAVVRDFLADDELCSAFLLEAQSRFPLEAAPFLKLTKTIVMNSSTESNAANQHLAIFETSSTFTQKLPSQFTSYRLLDDDQMEFDDVAHVELFRDLPLFAMRKSRMLTLPSSNQGHNTALAHSRAEDSLSSIPSGTIGVVTDDETSPKVVSWRFKYNPLQYIIRSLSTALAGSNEIDVASNNQLSLDEVSDIIGVLATFLTTLSRTESADDEESNFMRIVDDMTRHLAPGKDLTQIVFEIFEARLEQVQQSSNPKDSLELLIRCVQFFHAIALKVPSRIWPLFVRSQLLGLNGDQPSLVHVVTAIEMVSGRYEFLLSCIRLFDVLVESSMDNVISRQQNTRALTRFNTTASSDALAAASPAKTKVTVLMGFLRPLVSVFENCGSWRYDPSVSDRFDIKIGIAAVFTKILKLNYGVGNEPGLPDQVTGHLSESAEFLANYLLSTNPSRNLVEPLLDMLFTSVRTSLSVLRSSAVLAEEASAAALKLVSLTIRLGSYLIKPTSALETQLFSKAGIVARLFASNGSLQALVADLFDALITGAGRAETSLASLLGHMGKETARSFLAVLTRFMQPAVNAQIEIVVWNLLSSVISCRQHWFAVYLLTGSAPRDRSNKSKEAKADETTQIDGKSLFGYALDQLSSPADLSYPRAVTLLNFVSKCLNHWPWAVDELRRGEIAAQKANSSETKSFIAGITDYVMKLKRHDQQNSERTLYTDATIAGHVSEILAMYFYSARQLGDFTAVRAVGRKLAYLRNFGVINPAYNVSLHQRLHSNMKRAYPDLDLVSLKHTLLLPPEFGENYFYDINLARKMLRAGRKVRDEQSILKDMELANVNLSVVDSQISLVRRWTLLAVELSKSMLEIPKDDALQLAELLSDVVKQCLLLEQPSRGDASKLPPAAVLDKLQKLRLNLALVLLQRLVDLAQSSDQREINKSLRDVFSVAWDTTRNLQDDFDAAFTGSAATVYRMILQILYLTIKPLSRLNSDQNSEKNLRMSVMTISKGSTKDEELNSFGASSALLEILLEVVAKGFRSLSTILHQDPAASQPSDFVLLTGILQAILDVPGINLMHNKIALTFSNYNVAKYASSLFSWADQLANDDGDPVYGELSVLFLLSLSNIPQFAESMAVDGVLSQLSSANIMRYYSRATGMGPFDKPARMHSIWTRGILPLCLNLLDAVGVPIAPEVVSFLNQFPAQLDRLAKSLANRHVHAGARPQDSHITLSMASETHSLALINLLMERYRAAGPSMGSLVADIPELEWDKQVVKEDVEDWITGSSSLKDRIAPLNERDVELTKAKPVGNDPLMSNRLEERIFEEFAAAMECLTATNDI